MLSVNFSFAEEAGDEFDLSPEEFFSLDMNVVSPAKKLQKLKNVPSAVYVLTEEDIQRSAATNVMELLRLVPGLQVAKASSHEWAISARGFAQVFANKLLLLIDGAPVETVTFNGVFWENINLPLDTIERIEIIRGPGAAVWGTRAVNGIIHIITKDAFTHPSNSFSFGGGSEHLVSAHARTGSIISENAAIQGYVKYDKYDKSEDKTGNAINDGWDIFLANIRGDINLTEKDTLRVITSVSNRKADFEVSVPVLATPFSEAVKDEREHFKTSFSLLWDRDISEDSQISLEWNNYYERRDDFLLDYSAFNSDVEFRHRFRLAKSHDFTYGANFRFYTDDTEGSEFLYFDPSDRSLEFYRGFVSDEISLIDETLSLTLGSRFEQNSQVGFNALPTGRLLWNVNEKLSVWGAVSYTVGTPSRFNDDIVLNVAAFPEPTSGLPALVSIIGNRNIESEEIIVYELGAWAEPFEKFYLSATTFVFDYDKFTSRERGKPFPVLSDPINSPFVSIPLEFGNELGAQSVGFELAFDWAISQSVDLAASYSYIKLDAEEGSSQDEAVIGFIEDSPEHSFNIRGNFDLSDSVEADVIIRYVDELRTTKVSDYTEADVQFKWFLTPELDITVVGRNLLESAHEEFLTPTFNVPLGEVERSIFAKLNYAF